MSSTTPADGSAPIPPGYKAGDYVPFADRDPENPASIAGQWADPARQAEVDRARAEAAALAAGPAPGQAPGQAPGGPGGPAQTAADAQYRAIYGADAPVRLTYASWGRRVLGYLVDSLFSVVAAVPLYVGYGLVLSGLDYTTDAAGNRVISGSSDVSPLAIGLVVLGALTSIAFGVWNLLIRQGRTGYSLGKTVVGIRLVSATTGLPIGAGMSFVRQLAHVVDSLVCYLGWLWPLWDPRNQTLADKMVGTVVVVLPADRAQA